MSPGDWGRLQSIVHVPRGAIRTDPLLGYPFGQVLGARSLMAWESGLQDIKGGTGLIYEPSIEI